MIQDHTLRHYNRRIIFIFGILLVLLNHTVAIPTPLHIEEDNGHIVRVTTEKINREQRWPIKCSAHYEEDDDTNLIQSNSNNIVESDNAAAFCRPHKGGMCDRIVTDNFLNEKEISTLLSMADRGMNTYTKSTMKKKSNDKSALLPPAGPTIMDVNSGYVLPSGSHRPTSIYSNGQIYTQEEYDLYRRVTTKIKKFIETKFHLSKLYFTAPTFITREIGDSNWKAKTMHDEYWHVHSDKNNTKHYDYSGLIYLSEQDKDFTGGSLEFYKYDHLDCMPFIDKEHPGPCKIIGDPSLVVAPVPGRLIVFGSGRENPHRVNVVKSGTRYVLSFWFTCDESREFSNFLDGEMHKQFNGNGNKNRRRRKKKRKHRKGVENKKMLKSKKFDKEKKMKMKRVDGKEEVNVEQSDL